MLPQIDVEVAGHIRTLHLESLGDPTDPPLFVLHGTYTDYRGLRPLAVELSERYHVVIWDQRGAGLSERITAEELTMDSVVEEIDAIRMQFASDEPITLVGHSWGGGITALYASRRGEHVRQVAMLEPMPFDGEWMAGQMDQIVQYSFFNEGWNDQARLDELLAAADHETLDYRAALTLRSGMANYFCDRFDQPEWPIWRVGGYLEYARNQLMLDGRTFRYDFAEEGLEDFTTEVLILGGECGGLGAEFQRRQAVEWPDARVVEIPDAGHRLSVEQPELTLAALTAYLEEFQP